MWVGNTNYMNEYAGEYRCICISVCVCRLSLCWTKNECERV